MQYSPRFGLGWEARASAQTGQNLNSANAWAALGIRGFGVALNKVKIYLAITGTLAASDVTIELYSADGTTGKPASSVDGPVPCDAAPGTTNYHQWSGLTATLTDGAQYYAVVKNVNGSPTTNFPTVYIVRENIYPTRYGTSSAVGMNRMTTADGGTTWTNAFAGVGGPRFEFAGGIYRGVPVYDVASGGTTYGVYSTREAGMKFTSPANWVPNAKGLWIQVGTVTGTPTGNARLGLYVGSDSPVYTADINRSAFGSGEIMGGFFSTSKSIPPSSVCRIVLGETTQSDGSTNRFNVYKYSVENDATSKSLLPRGGWVATYWNGSSWVDTDSDTIAGGILLDDGGEFQAWARNHPGMTGGFNA